MATIRFETTPLIVGDWIILRLPKSASVNADETVTMTIGPSKEWPEPEVPADLNKALAADPQANALWKNITPMAHWDWLRWLRSTNNQETRNRRIEVALSKLRAGERRQCCFNRSLCTEPKVSKNGVLLEPPQGLAGRKWKVVKSKMSSV